ncbi:DUF2397 family protein [Streptomonospora salina]|uniref:DUF2397 family protein n=1 Tax=Streptomonospora salina TaxID=104205 RepID=UPI0028A6C3B3|nr:DUF2397 family protein [Streptomonospora salina]
MDAGASRLDAVVDRLEQRARWGDLVPGRREPAATIAGFTGSRVRYQAAKLAVRVQRGAEDVLSAAEGAREVSREPAAARGDPAGAAVQRRAGGAVRTAPA